MKKNLLCCDNAKHNGRIVLATKHVTFTDMVEGIEEFDLCERCAMLVKKHLILDQSPEDNELTQISKRGLRTSKGTKYATCQFCEKEYIAGTGLAMHIRGTHDPNYRVSRHSPEMAEHKRELQRKYRAKRKAQELGSRKVVALRRKGKK